MLKINTESIEKLRQFEALILKWQRAVNLISRKDEAVLWTRHILDSAQLFFVLPKEAKVLVDFGSGGGFPGIVLAILNKYNSGHLDTIYLIESDNKKCIFLQEVARILSLDICVINDRIENVKDICADVITARGFASVCDILKLGKPFQTQTTRFLLLKGEQVNEELKQVGDDYAFELLPACVENIGKIVCISEVKKNG